MDSLQVAPSLVGSLQPYVGLAKDAISVIAVVVGALWTWFLFVKKRIRHPNVGLTTQVRHACITEGILLFRVSVQLENKGHVMLRLGGARVWVQQVLPWDEKRMGDPRTASNPSGVWCTELNWPIIGEREMSRDELARCQIEPGEQELFCFDFIVHGDVEAVVVYAHFTQWSRRQKSLDETSGWNASTLYSTKEARRLAAATSLPELG